MTARSSKNTRKEKPSDDHNTIPVQGECAMSFKLADALTTKPDLLARIDRCVTAKRVFYTKREAQHAVRSINRETSGVMQAFCCAWCGWYHLGHRR